MGHTGKDKFLPILAPNQQPDLAEIKYPLYASNKLDGIRCIFYKGQILSRSLKPIVNKQLREKFEAIRKYTEEQKLILDGEIYSPNLTFQEITSFVMTQDLYAPKVGTRHGMREVPEHLKFYIFDCLPEENVVYSFSNRLAFAQTASKKFPNEIEWVAQRLIYSQQEVENLFDVALKEGCEGLILRDPEGRYKFGRGTLKEGLIYKVKPFVTTDAKVIGIVQSTEVNNEVEKKTNELGRSITSKQIGDRHLIEKASAVWVKYNNQDLKVSLACTDNEKKEIWKNQNSYIGKWIEYKYLEIGMKDGGLPRHPTSIRWRKDKD